MNKKMIAMVALTCVVTCITGCGSKKEDEVPDVTKQLEVIEEQADVWKVSEEKDGDFTEATDFDEYGYAVTDIDGDGMLEIIKSGWAGSGHYSQNTIFEVTVQGGLEKIDTSALMHMESEPDLAELGIKVATDKGQRLFAVSDLERLGLQSQTTYYVMDIVDNKVTIRPYEGGEVIEAAADVALWFRDINAENLLDSYKKFSGK